MKYLLFILAVVAGTVCADKCAINVNGGAYVGLSESANVFGGNADLSQYTFELWFNPNQPIGHEQNLLQTGIVSSTEGSSWAVEIKFKTTIWQRAETTPTGSVLYIDVWSKDANKQWSRTRFYAVLGGERFPWAKVSFAAGSNTLYVNNAQGRLEQYSPVTPLDSPRSDFALGNNFYGAIDDLRIWVGPPASTDSATLCIEEVSKQLELYIPFNECAGSSFLGHTRDGAVCALLYGSYDNLWIQTSPLAALECTPVMNDQCLHAKHSTSAPVSAEEATFTSNLYSLGTMVALVVCVAVIVGALAVIVRRAASRQHARIQVQAEYTAL